MHFKKIGLWCLSLFATLILMPSYASAQTDPLPSWNEGLAKKSILSFVDKVTKKNSKDFVAEPERIAVFDNDGTLWPENPIPFQLQYALYDLKQQLLKDPKLAADPIAKDILSGDMAKLLEGKHLDRLMKLFSLTHAGMTVEDFENRVNQWVKADQHPRFKKRYDQLTYQPMQEVLLYLRSKGFKTYIVSGGGADFMRVWSERVYGIPPEQVVGSTAQVVYELRDTGPVLVKTPNKFFLNDKEGKPVGIHQFIGRRPIACFGNSDGDQAMLEYTTINNPHASFGLIVHHTDAKREYTYDVVTRSSGKLDEALKAAPQYGWTVVDMKRDWGAIFSNGE